MVWESLIALFQGKKTNTTANTIAVKAFRKRYARFRKLLDANAALGSVMADLENRLSGKSLFGSIYLQSTLQNALRLTQRMVISLQGMRPGRYDALTQAFDRVKTNMAPFVARNEIPQEQKRALTVDLLETDLSMVDTVGGKCANLGEMASMAEVPVPRGFAITLHAFSLFMAHEGLGDSITALLATANPENREALVGALEEIRQRIVATPLPPILLQALEVALTNTFGATIPRLAVRSSALSEDGEKSFAGQFLSELGVHQDDLGQSYKRVIASLFTPSATMYRMHQGIALSDSGMAVGCLEMVDATASGVAYSHDPTNLLHESLVISGVCGLGRYLVDGLVAPDTWIFTREVPYTLIRRKAARKEHKLILNHEGVPEDCLIPEHEQKKLCLSEEEVQTLAALVMRLETHYGCYQDIEWAKDKQDKLIVLQSRPLGIRSETSTLQTPLLTNYPLLVEGGDSAYPGIGYGPVVVPATSADLVSFPMGGVLVAAHSSAEYAQVLDRAQAVLTQTGGITGHMATVCREFKIPTLLNVPDLMRTVTPGAVVTVDAFSARVYAGAAEELLSMRIQLDPVRLLDTPVYARLREAAAHVLPLHLTDPQAAGFTPANCTTLHDIMRYVHEFSYQEMFAISDSAADADGGALKFKAPLPIDLHIIDLDKGAQVPPGAHYVTPEQILSAPLCALLKGMMRPDTMFRRPRPVNMGGFLSVMGQQIGNPQGGDGRFGDKSYAIISDRYMNFSSRVGYHYSVLDSYCGNTTSKNYIAFSFQGGAAGETRRIRRCKAIALILEELGFAVKLNGDRLQSRFQKYEKTIIEDRLDQLGRLLQVTRQLDMLMVNDGAVVQFKENFMNGIYQ